MRDGSWASRLGATWVFNPGRQVGDMPTHIVVDTERNAAAWFSFEGAGVVDLAADAAPREMEELPDWVPVG